MYGFFTDSTHACKESAVKKKKNFMNNNNKQQQVTTTILRTLPSFKQVVNKLKNSKNNLPRRRTNAEEEEARHEHTNASLHKHTDHQTNTPSTERTHRVPRSNGRTHRAPILVGRRRTSFIIYVK